MKKILPIVVVGILVLGGLGAVAYPEPKKSTEIVKVKGGIGHVSIVIENTGEASIDNIEVFISAKGGVFDNIDVTESYCISILDIKAIEISETNKFIFGFGKIDITIDADYADTWIGTGFVFGPFIIGIDKLCYD
ncbi:MAG: hypothetical protein JSW06_04490 [Thermoplasmatales archaeon]|nr:MAG: hypothetical protein JSW06_04490 [Thermoplasmatales archaeon]